MPIHLAGVLQQQGGGAAFDVLNDIAWDAAYWEGGSEFAAQSYSDSDSVTTWPDEIGTDDLTGDPGVPIYDAVNASYNDAAVLAGNAASDRMTSAATYVQPGTVVIVGNFDATGADLFDGSTARWLFDGSGGSGRLFAGTARVTSWTVDTNPHLFVVYYNGASSYLEVDGTQYTVGGTVGTANLQDPWFRFGAAGAMAFVGVIQAELTSGEKSSLLSWSQGRYGTP